MSSRVDGCKRLIDGLHVFSLVRFPFAPSISRFFLFFLILFMVFYLNLSLKLFAFLCIESKFMIFSFYFNLFFLAAAIAAARASELSLHRKYPILVPSRVQNQTILFKPPTYFLFSRFRNFVVVVASV